MTIFVWNGSGNVNWNTAPWTGGSGNPVGGTPGSNDDVSISPNPTGTLYLFDPNPNSQICRLVRPKRKGTGAARKTS